MIDEDFVDQDKSADKAVSMLPNLMGIVSHAVRDDRSQSMIEDLAKRKKNIKPITENYCEDKESIRNRLDDSDRTITELLRDGRELIQDIRIANDKREVERRVKEAEIREELLEKLQTESTEAVAKFESITEKWSELKELKDPMGINDELQLQKERIQDLMKQKDIIIDECRKELEAADERYTRDIRKQTADIQSLVERVDNQIEIMKRAFKEHLDLLENTIDEERNILKVAASKKWDDLYTRRAVNERIKMKQEKERLEFYRDEIDRIEQEHIEVTRATRIRLEQDNQALEIELQKVKTNTTLNSEKLDYNFQVLKKREDENLMVRNAQKRRLTKLNETIFSLRRKIKDVQMSCLIETEKLTSDILKLRSNISHMSSKVNTFAEMNDRKYHSVWEMNKSECLSVLESILSIDKTLVEQHLGLKWQPPNFPDDHIQKISDTFNSITSNSVVATSQNGTVVSFENEAERVQIMNVLQIVLKQAGFLVDRTALRLIEEFTEEEKSLVCLDNVFNALGISHWEDVRRLKEKFDEIIKSYNQNASDSFTRSEGSVSSQSEENDLKAINFDNSSDIVVGSIVTSSEKLKTLKEFSQQLIASEKSPTPPQYGCMSRKVASKEVRDYWLNYKNTFPAEKVKVWDTMEENLTQYLKILKERKELDEECEFLRKQNMELQHLMQKMLTPNQIK
ncbi:dynein regulatory complex protein 1 homolog [Uranotaenia lowii]|uniref:dynein regulatory complex protein 1 homolog n=1 Tax=Uranotaenia lowii TaxID=190385 RepID=UPI0024790458|nr:dynein regulatory complex protein 1 homolog [Uranotaenia lowii]